MNNHWDDDRLERKQDAVFLYNFLIGQVQKRSDQGRIASYVLNVDADWGGGKSFFLDRLAKDIENHGHLVARVNAWRDDHAQDPYIAIMAAIDKVFLPYVTKPGKVRSAWTALKASGGPIAVKIAGAVAKGLIKKHLNVSGEDITGLIDDYGVPSEGVEEAIDSGLVVATEQLEKLFDATLEAMIEGFNRTDAAMIDFRAKLEIAVKIIADTRSAPLFILVDELDRCRPTYAVQLLERVKHLFEVPGVVFVFATNSAQLQHSIAGAYGPNFDGFRYMKRFFDRTYVFSPPTIEEYVESLCDRLPASKLRAPEGNLALALATGCGAYGFDLRAIGHVIEMVDAAATAWPHDVPADIVLFFAVCAHFHKSGKAEWPSSQNEEFERWYAVRAPTISTFRPPFDTSIYYGRIYRAALGSMRTIEEAMNLGADRPSDSWMSYAREIFSPEWNGKRVERSKPSIQMDLLGLVANAGRLSQLNQQPATQPG